MELEIAPTATDKENNQEHRQQQQQVHGYAGGHDGRLTISDDGRFVLKRTSLEEAHFYFWLLRLSEGVAAADRVDPLPTHRTCPLGCSKDCPLLQLNVTGSNASLDGKDADTYSAQLMLQWVPEAHGLVKEEREEVGKHPVTLILENLLFGLQNPIVIDIKLGTRLYGDLASPEKIERATMHARIRGADKLGISFCGLWGTGKGNEFKWEGGSRQKPGGFRPVTLEVYAELFRAFIVSAGDPVRASEQLLQMLQELKDIWKKQKIVNLYGSSLLIVAGTTETEKKVQIKMIDFAHPTFYPREKDMGYLKGLDSLISAVGEAAKTWDKGAGSGGCTELQALWQSRGV